MWKIGSLSNQTSSGSEKIIKGRVDNFSELSISIIILKEIPGCKGKKREHKKSLVKFQNYKIQEKKKIKISRENHSLLISEWRLNLNEASYQQHWKLEVIDAFPL